MTIITYILSLSLIRFRLIKILVLFMSFMSFIVVIAFDILLTKHL